MKLFCSQNPLLLILITVVSVCANAQEKINVSDSKKTTDDCNSYKYEKPEDFWRAKFRGGVNEKYLRNFVEQCPNSPYFEQAKKHLPIVLEENAEHNLVIAKYYLKKFEEHQGGFKGAWSRLKEITQKYPQYSKMDEVLFLLVKAELYQNEMDEAKKYYRRILNEFPFRNYVCEANKLFIKVPVD